MNTTTIPISAERFPECPAQLSDAVIESLTELCFGQNHKPLPEKIDILLIFGIYPDFWDYCARSAAMALEATKPDRIVITGGTIWPDHEMTEARGLWTLISEHVQPGCPVTIEEHSTDTRKNVIETCKRMELTPEYAGLVAYVCAWAHAGRVRLTLQKHIPRAQLLQHGYAFTLAPGCSLLWPSGWMHNGPGLNRDGVWGEFLRIKAYGERGDIHYPADVRERVEEIALQTGWR